MMEQLLLCYGLMNIRINGVKNRGATKKIEKFFRNPPCFNVTNTNVGGK